MAEKILRLRMKKMTERPVLPKMFYHGKYLVGRLIYLLKSHHVMLGGHFVRESWSSARQSDKLFSFSLAVL